MKPPAPLVRTPLVPLPRGPVQPDDLVDRSTSTCSGSSCRPRPSRSRRSSPSTAARDGRRAPASPTKTSSSRFLRARAHAVRARPTAASSNLCLSSFGQLRHSSGRCRSRGSGRCGRDRPGGHRERNPLPRPNTIPESVSILGSPAKVAQRSRRSKSCLVAFQRDSAGSPAELTIQRGQADERETE